MQFIELLESRYFLSAGILTAYEPLAASTGALVAARANKAAIPDARGSYTGPIAIPGDRGENIVLRITKQSRSGQISGTVTSQGKGKTRLTLSGSIDRKGKLTLQGAGTTGGGPTTFVGTAQLSKDGSAITGRLNIQAGRAMVGIIRLSRA